MTTGQYDIDTDDHYTHRGKSCHNDGNQILSFELRHGLHHDITTSVAF